MTRSLQTIPAEIVPLVLQALDNTRPDSTTNQLLTEAKKHLQHPGHERQTCGCATCHYYRRLELHLGKEPS